MEITHNDIKYTLKIAKNGRTMYYVGNKLAAKKNLPQEVLNSFEEQLTTETVDPEPVVSPQLNAQDDRPCIFCGIPATSFRFINMRQVPLCKEHYLQKTTGETVQRLREQTSA